MNQHQWKPHVTVAAIVFKNDAFLLVEEYTERGNRFNQPAGHLEDNESLIQAVIRECNEEAAYTFNPQSLLGIYHWKHEHNDTTYLRFAYIGDVVDHKPHQKLDDGIIRTVWMNINDMRKNLHLLRSPQVLKCAEDYLTGLTYPLHTVIHL